MQKNMHLYATAINELRRIVYESLKTNIIVDKEIYETLLEDVTITSDSDYILLLHRDIPSLLKTIFKELGFSTRIYHKKDEIDNYEYFVEIITPDSRCVFLGLCIDIDYETQEVNLLVAEAIPCSIFPHNILAYYHEIF